MLTEKIGLIMLPKKRVIFALFVLFLAVQWNTVQWDDISIYCAVLLLHVSVDPVYLLALTGAQ